MIKKKLFLTSEISPNLGKFLKFGGIYEVIQICPKFEGIPQISVDCDSLVGYGMGWSEKQMTLP